MQIKDTATVKSISRPQPLLDASTGSGKIGRKGMSFRCWSKQGQGDGKVLSQDRYVRYDCR